MKKKIIGVLFFIVVFVLPISWYLILQVFGENRFDLPILGNVTEECVLMPNQAFLIYDSVKVSDKPNEWKRLLKQFENIDSRDLVLLNTSDCLMENELLLVDEIGQIRGEYVSTREDMDRLFTEVDIYLLNLKSEKIERK